ncbi:helix-turn-helix domain-containing protein [[Pseudomonas] boreopolis]|uniref:AraC family transcriptional regulator n=1 Tax=Xanthomonas boreopolis TaxID=86183 RepID=UPI003D5C60DE
MSRPQPTAAAAEVARIAGRVPPLMPELFQAGTRLTGRWDNGAFDVDLQPTREHIVSVTYGGQGTAAASIDGKRLAGPVRPGSITISASGHGGRWCTTGSRRVSNVFLAPERLIGCVDEFAEGRAFELLDRVHEPDERLACVMGLLADEADAPGLYPLLFIEQALDLLCLYLLRSHSTLAAPAPPRVAPLAAWQVRRVTQYMRERLGHEIALQELAGLVSMSRFHFCRAFRQATGMAPHACLVHLRMQAACRLLVTTRLPLGTVAASVGYSSPASFAVAFRRVVGVSPSTYRERG